MVLSDFTSCHCNLFLLPKAHIFYLSSLQSVKEQQGKTISLQNRWACLWFAKLQEICSSLNPARKNLGAKIDAEKPSILRELFDYKFYSGYKTTQLVLFPFPCAALNSPDNVLVISGLWTVNFSHWLHIPVDSPLLTEIHIRLPWASHLSCGSADSSYNKLSQIQS